MSKRFTIGIVGCGLGGATIAALLQQSGFHIRVFEQTPGFSPVGAGIHLSPNVLKVLRRIGIERYLLDIGCSPTAFTSRMWDTGELLFNLPLGEAAKQRYGGAYLTVHRGDFHQALVSSIDSSSLCYGKRLESFENTAEGVRLQFEDGHQEIVDLVIGADGLSSRVRHILQGEAHPVYSGQVAYRSVFPACALKRPPTYELSKWWAPDRFVIAYYLTQARDRFYFVAGFPASDWPHATSSVEGQRDEMLNAFAGFHPEVQAILQASPGARKWPLFERPPNPIWHRGRVVILGDACHPMRPHMAQGAAMAIEDAAILSRCLVEAGAPHWEQAFRLYSLVRIERTSKVQDISSRNIWLRDPTDPSWVFSYDALNEPLVQQHEALTI